MSDYNYSTNFDALNREPGSGSLDEGDVAYDAASAHREERDPNRRTSFNPHESDDIEKWRRLNGVDSGVGDTGRRGVNEEYGQQVTIETLCGRLQCTDHHQRRVKHLFDEVDGDQLGSHSTEAVVMALISLVTNEDVVEDGEDVRDREIWDELLIAHQIDDLTIRRLRGKLHHLL